MEPLISDAELVARLVADDQDALVQLYDRHADRVFRAAYRLIGDRGQAEEVLQETYLALWNRADLFDSRLGSLSAWLLTICRNRAVDRLRAVGRRPVTVTLGALLEDEDHPDAGAVDHALRNGVPSGSSQPFSDPEQAIESAWLRGTVRAALDGLPDIERRAIELAYYHDLTQAEIAARLDWPLGTVKTRTRRALARLRLLLAEALGPELGARVAPVPLTVDETPRDAVTQAAGPPGGRLGGSDGPR